MLRLYVAVCMLIVRPVECLGCNFELLVKHSQEKVNLFSPYYFYHLFLYSVEKYSGPT